MKRLTYSGDRSLSALTQYITNYTVSPVHSSMQTGTEVDAASLAMPSYLFLQGIAVVPQQISDQLAFDLDQTVYTKAPEQVEHRMSLFQWSKTLLRAVSKGVSSPWGTVSDRHFSRQVLDSVLCLECYKQSSLWQSCMAVWQMTMLNGIYSISCCCL